MKRIKQLLAKGIDNLDDAEKQELLSLLQPEALAELSDADLAELKEIIQASAASMLDSDDNSDVTIEALEALANVLDVVRADEDRRAMEAEEADRKKDELRDRIRGGEEVDEAPDAGADDESLPRDDVDENGEPIVVVEEVPVEEPELVTAAAPPARSSVTAPRPRSRQPRPREVNARQAPIRAAANVPGVTAGMELDTDDKLFRAFDAAVRLAQGTEGAFTMPVISLRSEIPDEMQLDRDPEKSERTIARRSSPEAIVAAGGACALVPYSYDLPTVGDDVQPVRDGLTRYGAQRAGVSFFTPPTITDVMGTGATTSAISQWTYANDTTPGSDGAETKPYLRIDCGNNTPTTTRVYALVTQYESGNMLERWYPELIQAYTKLIGVWGARFSEAKRLAAMASLSKVVSHGQVLGSASDIFPALDQLIMGIRYRHRIVSNVTLRIFGFEWVRTSIITDLIRRGAADRPVEERLRMAISEVDTFFRARNCNITWSPDFQYGVNTIGAAGGPVAGVQNPGPVVGFPTVARFYVSIEGSFLFLDGGEFRIGVMRDVTKVRTNDWVFFTETFENVVYHGVPGEAYVYDIDICANGGYSSPLDITPCVSNS